MCPLITTSCLKWRGWRLDPKKSTDLAGCLQNVLRESGYEFDCSDIYNYVREIAQQEVKMHPGPVGPTGPMGPSGSMGRRGYDAWDKFAFDSEREVFVRFYWKGIEFLAPVPICLREQMPEGELTYGDIGFIQTISGPGVVERIAAFWRREYDAKEDMALFINEEDKCHLLDINQSNSSPGPLRDFLEKPSLK